MDSKKGKGMRIAHYIITFAILGVVIWLAMAEIKRMKVAKEVANNTPPAETNGTGTTTEG